MRYILTIEMPHMTLKTGFASRDLAERARGRAIANGAVFAYVEGENDILSPAWIHEKLSLTDAIAV